MIGWFIGWVLVSTGLLIALALLVDRLQKAVLMERSKSHAMCIAAVFAAIGDATAARALRDAAKKWESVEEQHRIKTLANTQYTPGGPSVPALWLLDEASRLDPQSVPRERAEV